MVSEQRTPDKEFYQEAFLTYRRKKETTPEEDARIAELKAEAYEALGAEETQFIWHATGAMADLEDAGLITISDDHVLTLVK